MSFSGNLIFAIIARMFCDGVFDDFPKISDYFPKISENSFKTGPVAGLCDWSNDRCEYFGKFPKIAEGC